MERGALVAVATPVEYVERNAFDAAFNQTVKPALQLRHEREPWRIGMTAAELGAALQIEDQHAARLLAAWHDDGRVGFRAKYWHLPEFRPELSEQQQTFYRETLSENHAAPLMPHSYEDLTKSMTAAKIPGLSE